MTARISSYLDRRGYYTELIRLNREILELEPDKDSMNWIAQAYAHQMDLENAAQWYKRPWIWLRMPSAIKGWA